MANACEPEVLAGGISDEGSMRGESIAPDGIAVWMVLIMGVLCSPEISCIVWVGGWAA